MDRLLVTGARGLIGSWVTRHFAGQYHVVGVDRSVPPPDTVPSGATFYQAELTQYGEIAQLLSMTDPDAVIHLAAIPHAGRATERETVQNNTIAAYNVLAAAGRAGVDVCWTSSDAVYGDGHAKLDATPITEATPPRPHNGYALSKVLSETVAEYVAEQCARTIVTVRPTWVNAPGEYGTAATRAAFDPETTPPDDIAAANLWSYIDIRDLLSLFERILAAIADEAVTGHERVLAAAAETYLDRPTAAAVEAVFDRSLSLSGTQSIYETSKAKATFGWEPTHSWHSAEEEPAQTPPFQA